MKTAVSLPADLFRSADALARRLGLSRSVLYQRAIAEYLAKHQARKVTERLDAVYGKRPSTLDPEMAEAQVRTVRRSQW